MECFFGSSLTYDLPSNCSFTQTLCTPAKGQGCFSRVMLSVQWGCRPLISLATFNRSFFKGVCVCPTMRQEYHGTYISEQDSLFSVEVYSPAEKTGEQTSYQNSVVSTGMEEVQGC